MSENQKIYLTYIYRYTYVFLLRTERTLFLKTRNNTHIFLELILNDV
jgi:hypothetical protein